MRMSFTGRTNPTGGSPSTDGFLPRTLAGTSLATSYATVVELLATGDELVAVHVGDDIIGFEAVPERERCVDDQQGAIVSTVCFRLLDRNSSVPPRYARKRDTVL